MKVKSFECRSFVSTSTYRVRSGICIQRVVVGQGKLHSSCCSSVDRVVSDGVLIELKTEPRSLTDRERTVLDANGLGQNLVE